MATLPVADTGLGREIAPCVAAHPGQSGFALLQHGPAALLARSVLADLAMSSIDVQYYIYENDLSGALLTHKLLAAADRGVQVRILLDDNNLRTPDEGLKLLASHPHVEIRVFNPWHLRMRWLRPFELLARFNRLQRRMHNKIFAVDGVTGVFGGRNIGDHYFDVDRDSHFADFDVFVAGPLIEQAASSFESYWQHPLAVTAESLTATSVTPGDLAAGRAALARRFDAVDDLEERYERARSRLTGILEDPETRLTWAEAEFVADPPDKLLSRREADSPLLDRLAALWRQTAGEVLIESAYFVPHREGAGFICEQALRGLRTCVLTNSLAANDVLAVHAGYARYRRRLLKAGVELYEFQRRAMPGLEDLRLASRRSNASLHAKVAVFDRRYTWVGSFNLDPRSARLNTELAIVIDSPALARQAAALISRDLEPDRAWRLSLESRLTGGREMVWRGQREGRQLRLSGEPDASWWQRAAVALLQRIPGIEALL